MDRFIVSSSIDGTLRPRCTTSGPLQNSQARVVGVGAEPGGAAAARSDRSAYFSPAPKVRTTGRLRVLAKDHACSR